MLLRLLAAVGAGACIGYERSFHGRPAGLRTHVLVCLASAVLMLVTVYEAHWVRASGEERLDPTRMAQGIMTGIGFLGAGVIVKEGLNVRGLTTAASIWITAAIGVLAGVGLYVPMLFSVVLTRGGAVGVPLDRDARTHAGVLLLRRASTPARAISPRKACASCWANSASASRISATGSRASGDERCLRHKMTLQTTDRNAASRLARYLEENQTVLEFRLSPDGRLNMPEPTVPR